MTGIGGGVVVGAIKEFGSVAQGLARNPLGIIALFIVLIYGFACLVVGGSGVLTNIERMPIVWFMSIFPVVVLFSFLWLVAKHHKKLYAPSDFKSEEHFLANSLDDLRGLGVASPDGGVAINGTSNGDELTLIRNRIYNENRGIFIAHILDLSKKDGQKYDIFIYLIGHKEASCNFIEKAEFFFGQYWGNKIYVASKSDGVIGVRTSAYGPFLALCRVKFKDGSIVMLQRYIDFEMGRILEH